MVDRVALGLDVAHTDHLLTSRDPMAHSNKPTALDPPAQGPDRRPPGTRPVRKVRVGAGQQAELFELADEPGAWGPRHVPGHVVLAQGRDLGKLP
jgi:hypothetical protein